MQPFGCRTSQDHSGNTALHYACLANLPDVARLLLDRGSDFQIANKTGNTPLHYAVTSGMTSAVELLLVHRADIDARYAAGGGLGWGGQCARGRLGAGAGMHQKGSDLRGGPRSG